jgi:hypothetical protein
MDRKTISNLDNSSLVKEYKKARKKRFAGSISQIEKELKKRGINPNSKMAYLCKNQEDLFGNKFKDSSNLIIIQIGKTDYVCLTRYEYKKIIDNGFEEPTIVVPTEYDKKTQYNLYWNSIKNAKKDPKSYLYKIGQIGIVGEWVDHTFKDLYDRKINTMKLVKKGNFEIMKN